MLKEVPDTVNTDVKKLNDAIAQFVNVEGAKTPEHKSLLDEIAALGQSIRRGLELPAVEPVTAKSRAPFVPTVSPKPDDAGSTFASDPNE